MYQLTSGAVAVYSVYSSEAECRAVAHTLQYNVSTGLVSCEGITLPEEPKSTPQGYRVQMGPVA